MQTPASDALTDRLAITCLASPYRVALATTNTADKVMTSRPQSCAAMLNPINCPAGKTLDVKIQGRRLSTDAYTDLVTFVQTAGGVLTPQRANVPSYPRYRVVETVGGSAFNGTTDSVAYDLVLVGTDTMANPIVQA